MNTTIIVAPTTHIARHMVYELRDAGFDIRSNPSFVLYEDGDRWRYRMAGIERMNVFVATSPRDFLSAKEWPQFVKRVRQEYEIRACRGMCSTWIEVYLP